VDDAKAAIFVLPERPIACTAMPIKRGEAPTMMIALVGSHKMGWLQWVRPPP